MFPSAHKEWNCGTLPGGKKSLKTQWCICSTVWKRNSLFTVLHSKHYLLVNFKLPELLNIVIKSSLFLSFLYYVVFVEEKKVPPLLAYQANNCTLSNCTVFFLFVKLWSSNTIDTVRPFNSPVMSKMKSWSLESQSTIMWIVKLSRYIQQLQENDRRKPLTSQHCFIQNIPKMASELGSAFN